jgi:hypothetical protein|tara:strand:+ start:214 stop:345 length:132 start_codon:yes stop_codon:yes gene_type:complete
MGASAEAAIGKRCGKGIALFRIPKGKGLVFAFISTLKVVMLRL